LDRCSGGACKPFRRPKVLSGTGSESGAGPLLSATPCWRRGLRAGLPQSLAQTLIGRRGAQGLHKNGDAVSDNPAAALDGVWRDWLIAETRSRWLAARCDGYLSPHFRLARRLCWSGPTGERNTYTLGAAGRHGAVCCVDGQAARTPCSSRAVLAHRQTAGALFEGPQAGETAVRGRWPASLKQGTRSRAQRNARSLVPTLRCSKATATNCLTLVKDIAKRPGPIVSVQGVCGRGALESGDEDYAPPSAGCLTERSVRREHGSRQQAVTANLMTIG